MVIKKKGESNICQELYSDNSVQLISIKHLLCAKRPTERWGAIAQTRTDKEPPPALSLAAGRLSLELTNQVALGGSSVWYVTWGEGCHYFGSDANSVEQAYIYAQT